MKWFYLDDGKQIGPITEKDLGRLIEAGILNESSLVRREDLKDWTRLIESGLVEFEDESLLGEEIAMKHFDLNIDKILENWELSHAVRELIANALDEATLTKTSAPKIYKDDAGWWRIRDFGRGLRYQDLIQSENPEKLGNPHVIGKFGIGLKDALATFERKDIRVMIRSKHGDISLTRVAKHSFEDIVTLHATVAPAIFPNMQGTECFLLGVPDIDVDTAKSMFLCFSDIPAIESTSYGEVHKRTQNGGIIYINGMKVAEEQNFLFSYNITSLNAAIKRALNRERQNLGRAAYSDRVRAILLACKSEGVAQLLATDLQSHSYGDSHDELLSWIDVQKHAVRILNSLKKVFFVSATELSSRPDLIDDARSTGFQVVAVPDNLTRKIQGISDISGNPVTEIHQFVKQHNEGFHFEWVLPSSLTPSEASVWAQCDSILRLIGGLPRVVKDIRISETMRRDPNSSGDTIGLWDGDEGWIIVKRSQLQKLPDFAATLLHEALHAKYEISDVSRDFESYLTELVGDLAARLIILTNTEQGAGGYSLKPAAELDEAKYEAAKGLFTSKLERLNNDESEFLKWVAVKFPDSAMPYAKRFLEERANPKSQSLHSTQEK